jgi:site-specific DNA-adenine methylase
MKTTKKEIVRPFFSYFGSKWRGATYYPEPLHDTIIEPFAGSAGYSLRHYERNVLLNDKYPAIYKIWDYLINVSETEIRRLPTDLDEIYKINCSEPARMLIGFWFDRAEVKPQIKPSGWMRNGKRPEQFWGENVKERIAKQLKYIRHWKIYNNDYRDLPNDACSWFIDPPYQIHGKHYVYGNNLDYNKLGSWCKERQGQAIICEQDGAKWLPFQEFRKLPSLRAGKTSFSLEVMYHKVADNDNTRQEHKHIC